MPKQHGARPADTESHRVIPSPPAPPSDPEPKLDPGPYRSHTTSELWAIDRERQRQREQERERRATQAAAPPPLKLDDLGISPKQSSRFQAIASIPEPEF